MNEVRETDPQRIRKSWSIKNEGDGAVSEMWWRTLLAVVRDALDFFRLF